MRLRFLTAGESHGPALVVILEGMPAGLPINPDEINQQLERRQSGYGAGARMKIEQDEVRILSGVMGGVTIGAPIAMLIENRDHQKWKGKPIPPMTIPRPGHADLSATIKYDYNDLRPALERASARETAARVAAGAICKSFLAKFKIQVGGYVTAIGEVTADVDTIPLLERFALAEKSPVRCPDQFASEKMKERIRRAMEEKETLGGIIEILGLGVPAGLGSHVQWDRRLEARLGAAILSVQAIKGVEFGSAFENTRRVGTQAQDAIHLENGNLVRKTLRAGGIEGGISNGEPIVVRAAMKPIATTLTPQASVDLLRGEEVTTQYERSDFCPVPRAVPILEAMTAFVLADELIEKLGGDTMKEMQSRFKKLRKPRLDDFQMDGKEQFFWEE